MQTGLFSLQDKNWAQVRDKDTQLSKVWALTLNLLRTNISVKLSTTGIIWAVAAPGTETKKIKCLHIHLFYTL